MAQYTLIASRDPFDSREARHYFNLAVDLKQEGNEVTLFLVQNGVFGSRSQSNLEELENAVTKGVEVLADDFSLRERGIAEDQLQAGIEAAALDIVIDHMAAGRNVIWH